MSIDDKSPQIKELCDSEVVHGFVLCRHLRIDLSTPAPFQIEPLRLSHSGAHQEHYYHATDCSQDVTFLSLESEYAPPSMSVVPAAVPAAPGVARQGREGGGGGRSPTVWCPQWRQVTGWRGGGPLLNLPQRESF